MINLVHGIRGQGEDSIDKLIPALHAVRLITRDINYPKISATAFALTPRKWNRERQFRDGQIVVDATEDGEDIIAHSRGCLVATRAMEIGRKFRCAFFFAPAMNADFFFPEGAVEYVWIIYCPNDAVIKLAGLIPWNDGGSMGRIGYNGPAHPSLAELQVEAETPAHSHYFFFPHLEGWSYFIADRIVDPAGVMANEKKQFKPLVPSQAHLS